MLVYEKINEGERHLYGTFGTAPSLSDTELSYTDGEGSAITPVKGDTYLVSKDNPAGMVRTSDDKFVAVYIGTDCIIPSADWEPDTPPNTDDDKSDKDDEEQEPLVEKE